MASFFGWLASLFGGGAGASTSPGQHKPMASPPRPPVERKIATATEVKPRSASLDNTDPIIVDATSVRYALSSRIETMRDAATIENDRLLLELLKSAVEQGSLDFPRFPAVAEELLTLDASSNLDGKAIADLIARDPDLAARIVQLASSPAFGGVRQTSLPQAVTRIGFEQVRYVAVGAAIGEVVYRVPGYDKEVTALRDAGLAAGMLSARLARATGRSADSGMAFLGGLFHDIGQGLVLRNLSKLRLITKGGAPSQLLVKNLMADAHLPLGTLYAIDRNLPPAVIAGVAAHHEPNRAGANNKWLSFIIWTADQMQERAADLKDKEKLAKMKEEWPAEAPPFDKVLDTLREMGEVKVR